MRSIHGVRQAILNVIPDDEIRSRLAGVTEVTLREVPFRAPEMMPRVWETLSQNLVDIVGAPQPGTWREMVADIFNGKVDFVLLLSERQREQFGVGVE